MKLEQGPPNALQSVYASVGPIDEGSGARLQQARVSELLWRDVWRGLGFRVVGGDHGLLVLQPQALTPEPCCLTASLKELSRASFNLPLFSRE